MKNSRFQLFVVLMLLLLSGSAMAQRNEGAFSNEIPGNPKTYGVVFRWNPLELINPNQKLLLGIEKSLGDHYSLVGEAGYIINDWTANLRRSKISYIAKVEGRIYLGANHDVVEGFFMSGQLTYKSAKYHIEDEFCINANGAEQFGGNNECVQWQSLAFDTRLDVYTANFKFGFQERYWRLMWEAYFGAGIRSYQLTHDQDIDIIPSRFGWLSGNGSSRAFERSGRGINALLGITIGYYF